MILFNWVFLKIGKQHSFNSLALTPDRVFGSFSGSLCTLPSVTSSLPSGARCARSPFWAKFSLKLPWSLFSRALISGHRCSQEFFYIQTSVPSFRLFWIHPLDWLPEIKIQLGSNIYNLVIIYRRRPKDPGSQGQSLQCSNHSSLPATYSISSVLYSVLVKSNSASSISRILTGSWSFQRYSTISNV